MSRTKKDIYPELLSSVPDAEERRLRNARLTLKHRAHIKAGETVTVLMGERDGHRGGPNRLDAIAIAKAASEMGAYPLILDISEFRDMPIWKENVGFEAVRQAIIHSDIVFGSVYRFERLGFDVDGSPDAYLVGDREQRWVAMMPYMDRWDFTEEEIAAIEPVTKELLARVEKGHTFRVTSPAGTDFTFETLSAKQILGIYALYGEVAIMPKFGSGSGIVVVDGPTQKKVRPPAELDREPMRIQFENGEVVSYTGDAEQIARLEAFINSAEVKGKYVDEVGIPTTRAEANNECWTDGTHNCNTIHIAIGNNNRRSEIVHGQLHMDMEVKDPTFYIDGEIVMKDTKFIF